MSYLLKIAEEAMNSPISARLPHQEKAVQKALANDGSILLSHPMGSGKTRTSVEIVEELKRSGKAGKALVVVPSSLRTNYLENGVKKWTRSRGVILGSLSEEHPDIYSKHIPKSDYYVVSYDMFRKDPHAYLDRLKPDTMVVDEVHNFRNEGTKNLQSMREARQKVRNFIGMTGTLMNNDPSDLHPIIDLVSNGKHKLGPTKDKFKSKFIGGSTGRGGRIEPGTAFIKNEGLLKSQLDQWVHHADDMDVQSGDIPKKVVEDVMVEMTPEQKQHYDFVMKKVPFHVREKIRNGMPATRKEAFSILPMLQQVRAVSNSVGFLDKRYTPHQSAELTPKAKKALDDVHMHLNDHPKNQALMHSHLVNGGVDVLSAGLKARGIPHGVISGSTPHAERDRHVKDYNAGKLRALVLSSAGTTGLNLPNTTFHAALDGHYNPAVIDQIEARGVRAGGQAYRPKESRKVIVKRYRSTYPQTFLQRIGLGKRDKSVDEWIYNLANDKKDVNYQVEQLMKKTAVKMTPMLALDLADEAFDTYLMAKQVESEKKKDAAKKSPRVKTASLGTLLFAAVTAAAGPEWLGGPGSTTSRNLFMRLPEVYMRLATIDGILKARGKQLTPAISQTRYNRG